MKTVLNNSDRLITMHFLNNPEMQDQQLYHVNVKAMQRKIAG